jgi:hypothetical protein
VSGFSDFQRLHVGTIESSLAGAGAACLPRGRQAAALRPAGAKAPLEARTLNAPVSLRVHSKEQAARRQTPARSPRRSAPRQGTDGVGESPQQALQRPAGRAGMGTLSGRRAGRLVGARSCLAGGGRPVRGGLMEKRRRNHARQHPSKNRGVRVECHDPKSLCHEMRVTSSLR